MAILTSQPGLKISIVDNSGTAFQELPDPDAEHSEKLVSRYIEARSGTEFGIRWEITSPWPAHTLLLRFYVDKKCVASVYCFHHNYGRGKYTDTQTGASFVVNGQAFQQKFAFAALDIGKCIDHGNLQALILSDDSAPPHGLMVQDIMGIGDIQVKAHFVKNLVPIASNNDRAVLDSARLDKIPEKALKGQSLSHQTVLVLTRCPISMKITDHSTVLEQYSLWATAQCRLANSLIQRRILLLHTYSSTGRGVSRISLGYSFLHANAAQMHSSHFSSYHGAQVLYRWKSGTLTH